MKKFKKETIFTLNNTDDLTYIDDVVYLPEKTMSPQRLGQFGAWLKKQEWFHKIIEKGHFSKILSNIMALDHQNTATLALMLIRQEWEFPYGRSTSPGMVDTPEPEWLKHFPKDVLRELRRNWAIGGGIEPLGIVCRFPYMGFAYIIQNDFADGRGYSLANETGNTFNLFRLQEVRQLAWLKDPVGFQDDRTTVTLPFDHTRWLHSVDTLAVGTILGYNCRLTPREQRTLCVACECHDGLTPAGGDSTKLIDPVLFDEDRNFPRLLRGKKWQEFSEKWEIDGNLLAATIRGEGVLGQLLNVADKTSYISRDTFAFLGGRIIPREAKFAGGGYYMIADLVEEHPHITALWEVTKVIDGKVIITDAERLSNLLVLRALLFKELYYNPFSRFFEYLLGKGLSRILYRRGDITYDDLLKYGDWWLSNKIDEYLETHYALSPNNSLEHARIEEYPDFRAACRRAAEFDSNPEILVIVDDFKHVSNSAVNDWLVKDKGEIKTFGEARPKMADRIEQIMYFPPLKRVYFFHMHDLNIPPRSRAKVKAAFLDLRKELEQNFS